MARVIHPKITMQDNFDYIVVGAGSAGCVVAHRLAESGASVALLEAGSCHYSIYSDWPFGTLKLTRRNSPFIWHLHTAPQKGLYNRTLRYIQGKILGGSSAVNGMVYVRGAESDYNRWGDLDCPGWHWKEVLPYFIKAENYVNGEVGYHGLAGPVHIAPSYYKYPIADIFLQAARQAGHGFIEDFNSSAQTGASFYRFTMHNGKRCSASRAYLQNSPDALTIIKQAHVNSVIIKNNKAVGVLLANGRKLYANKETIISAGAIHSPQILLRSGLGAATGLPAIGKHLRDHLYCQIHCITEKNITFGITKKNILAWPLHFIKYLLKHNGALAANLSTAGLFLRSDATLADPDIQVQLICAPFHKGKLTLGYYGYTLHIAGIRLKSQGNVSLSSINPAYLTHPADLAVMRTAYRSAQNLLQQAAFADCRGQWRLPNKPLYRNEEINDYIKRCAIPGLHPMGTCRMGRDRNNAVVDNELRVHGIASLRVIDNSVIPTPLGGNTNAAALMIGEKGAAIILKGSV